MPTSSSYDADQRKVTFDWEVEGFVNLKTPNGKWVVSETFPEDPVPGFEEVKWVLSLFPNGSKGKQHVSLSLDLMEPRKPFTIEPAYVLSVVDEEGNSVNGFTLKDKELFEARDSRGQGSGYFKGYQDFALRSALNGQNLFGPNGELRLRCEVFYPLPAKGKAAVIRKRKAAAKAGGKGRSKMAAKSVAMVKIEKVDSADDSDSQSMETVDLSEETSTSAQNMEETNKGEKGSFDVTLNARGRKIKAHAAILSSKSPVFKDMFAQRPKPTEVKMKANHQVVQALQQFLYMGDVKLSSLSNKYVEELVDVAIEYNVQNLEELKSKCRKKLGPQVTVASAAASLIAAHQKEDTASKETLLSFITRDRKTYIAVKKTKEWKEVKQDEELFEQVEERLICYLPKGSNDK